MNKLKIILLSLLLLPSFALAVTAVGWNTPTPSTGWVIPNAVNGTNQIIFAKNGLFSIASSTFSSNLFLSNLSQGLLYTGSNGLVKSLSTSTLSGSGVISVTAGAYVPGATPIVVSCPTCGSSTVQYDWLQENNIFGTNALTPTSTIPIEIKSTASSTFAGGLEAWREISTPYFQATSTTATSTIANALKIGSTSGDNALKIDASGRIYPASVSVGGAVNIDEGTQAQSPALVIHDNSSGAGTGRLVVINQEGTAVTQDMILASSSGSNVTAFNVKGFPTGKGVIKIEHTGGGTGFSNGSALSIDLLNATDVQGIFIKGSIGGTGKLLNIVDSSSGALASIGSEGRITGIYSSTTAYASSLISSSTFDNAGTFSLNPLNPVQGIAYIGSAGKLGATATSTFSLSQFTNDLASLSATNASLTFTGSYNGSVARTVGINLGNTNTWTVLQNFNYSSSTIYSSNVTASSTFENVGTLTLNTLSGVLKGTAGLVGTASNGTDYTLITAKTCTAGDFVSAVTAAGVFTCTTPSASSGGSDPFTHPLLGLSATTSQILIGTSTASNYQLTISSTTVPQLSFSAGAGLSQWVVRNAGGNFYLATTTVAGTATSSVSALTVDTNGNLTVSGTGAFSADGITLGGDTGLFRIAPDILATFDSIFFLGTNSVISGVLSGSTSPGGSLRLQSTTDVSKGSILMAESGGIVGVGTSTPVYELTVSSSTAPQLALSTGAGFPQFVFRNSGGIFYIATTTTAGTATSTVEDLSINANGILTVNNGIIAQASSTVVGGFRAQSIGAGKAPSASIRYEALTDGTYTQAYRAEGDSSSRLGFSSFVTGDGQVRYTQRIDGLLAWGDGTTVASGDTTLSRGSLFHLNANQYFGVATTTGTIAGLTISSTTASQLSLSNGAGIAQWTFRNAGGSLYISTTTVDGLSTTSIAAIAFSGSQILIPDGTGAAPSIAFLDDSNNGIGSPANDIFAIYTNGLERFRADDGTGNSAFGTTTPKYLLTLASSTASQLALSDGISGDVQWTQRNAGGNLYFSTTTVAGTATTSLPALSILGATGLTGIASSTPWGLLSVNPIGIGSGVPEFVVGSSTATHLVIDGAGQIGIGTTTPQKLFHVYGSQAGGIARIERRTAGSSGTDVSPAAFGTYDVAFSDTGTGHNWLGPSQTFSFIDSAGTVNSLAQIAVFRVGADTAGIMRLTANNSQPLTISGITGVIGIGTTTPGNDTLGGVRNLEMTGTNSVGLVNISASSTPSARVVGMYQTYAKVAGGGGQDGVLLGSQSNHPLEFFSNNTQRSLMDASGNWAFGTTSALYLVNPYSATAPQLSLSAGPAIAQFAFRNAGGNLYIATTTLAGNATTSVAALELRGTGAMFAPFTSTSGAAQTGAWCYNASGEFIRESAVCTVSALKFKKDVQALDVGLTDLNKINFVSYFKKDPLGVEDSHRQMGVIADDVAKISPALNEMLVTYVGGGTSGEVHAFRYDQFTALLGKSIQELNKKVDELPQAGKAVKDKWPYILIALQFVLFASYVVYNEKRRK